MSLKYDVSLSTGHVIQTDDFGEAVKKAYGILKAPPDNILTADVTTLRKIVFPTGEDDLDMDNPTVDRLMTAVLLAAGVAKKNDVAWEEQLANDQDQQRLQIGRDYITNTLHLAVTGIPDEVLLEICDTISYNSTEASKDITEDNGPVEVVTMDDEVNALVTASGEIVCFVDAPVSDLERRNILEWVGERREKANARIAGITAEKKHWLDKIDKMYNPQMNKQTRVIARLDYLYGPVGKAYLDEAIASAEKAIKDGKTGTKIPKSLKIGLLTLKYKTTKASVQIIDLAKAILWCRKNAKDAIKEEILKSVIPDAKKSKLTKEASEITGIYAYPGGDKEFVLD